MESLYALVKLTKGTKVSLMYYYTIALFPVMHDEKCNSEFIVYSYVSNICMKFAD